MEDKKKAELSSLKNELQKSEYVNPEKLKHYHELKKEIESSEKKAQNLQNRVQKSPHKYVRVEKFSKYHPASIKESDKEFEARVKHKCKIPTESGIYVQSHGEKVIADFLYEHDILFVYDEPVNLNAAGEEITEPGHKVRFRPRPDFRIKETDVIIEYWGMLQGLDKNSSEYDQYLSKLIRKREIYAISDMELIEIYPEQIEEISHILSVNLTKHGVLVK